MVACLIIENETADCYHGTNVMRNGSKGMYNIDTGFIHSGKVRRKLSFFFFSSVRESQGIHNVRENQNITVILVKKKRTFTQ